MKEKIKSYCNSIGIQEIGFVKCRRFDELISFYNYRKENNLEKSEELKKLNKRIIKISAKNGNGIEELYNEIENMFQIKNLETDGEIIITNIRHKNQIEYAINNINEAINAVKNNLPIDIISISIKQTLEDLGKITGENVSEDIINEIFSKFCLGK